MQYANTTCPETGAIIWTCVDCQVEFVQRADGTRAYSGIVIDDVYHSRCGACTDAAAPEPEPE